MQLIPAALIGAVLFVGLPALAEPVEPAPAKTASIAAQSQKKELEKQSPEKFISQLLEHMKKISKLMEDVKDRESADKAAQQIELIKKDIFQLKRLAEKMSVADQRKIIEGASSSEHFEQMAGKFEKEKERLEEARYYGSSALKEVVESDEDPNEESPEASPSPDADGLIPPL